MCACLSVTVSHVIEPKYPGLVERYVNLGECYDRRGLQTVRERLMHCMDGYKGCYRRAYRCLRAAAELREDARATLLEEAGQRRVAQRAERILARELPPCTAQTGVLRQRFLSAITHKGVLCLSGTVRAQCARVIHLSDRYGLAHELLTHLLSGALRRGYDVVACPDPMAPERLAQLLLPEASLAIVSSSLSTGRWQEKSERTLRMDSLVSAELLRGSRAYLRFSQRMGAALIAEAVESLAQAKEMHDALEAVYNPFVNFERVQHTAEEISSELFS